MIFVLKNSKKICIQKIEENRQNRGKGYISAILPALDILFFFQFSIETKRLSGVTAGGAT